MNTTLLILAVLLWKTSTGLREGYTFTKVRDRLPFMDYHAWRYLEELSIVLMIYAVGGLFWMVLYIGANWALTYTVYEPLLDYMVTGKWIWFKDDNPYEIFSKPLNQGTLYQLSVTMAGILIINAALIFKELL